MRVVVRGKKGRLRSATAFGISGWIHGALLGWLILAAAGQTEPRKSVYDEEIRPHQEHLVWYSLRDRLPDISPAPDAHDRRPPRAHHQFNQTLVAGTKEDARPQPLIRMPEPKALAPKLPPLPNVLAVSPHPERAFVAPRMPKPAAAPAVLLEAPKASAPPTAAGRFQPVLPLPPRRDFTPPPASQPVIKAGVPLPDAPTIGGPRAAEAAYHAAVLPPPTRDFTPPPVPKSTAGPAAPVVLPDAPSTSAALPAESATPAMAIAGLDPAKLTDLPKPPGTQEANFSAGPELRPKGGAEGNGGGTVVPGLLARGGTPSPTPTVAAPLARPKWMDALHPLDGVLPSPETRRIPEPRAARVSDSPDDLLRGRAVYTMAIQMPNVTSYSGSWLVWFAERIAVDDPVEIQPPEPRRKVDPKYVASAVADRVEGKVRLSAVIRKDGTVDSVVLLRHLDPRLDQTAEEALSKWIFLPARRNGLPIDVDAVFEIPFYLAAKSSR